MVELVWGATSFNEDRCVHKVSESPCSEEKRLTNCVLQGSKGEAGAQNQERGTRSRRGGPVGSPAEQFVRCVQAGQRRRRNAPPAPK
jgi:hypothetical protein